MVDLRTRATFGTAALAATAIAVVLCGDRAAFAQAKAPASAESTIGSWYGDPKAPDLSGVWVRVDAPVGAGSREGWLPWPPPLRPAFAAVWRKRVADAAAGTRTDDPVRGCLPPGMPRFMTGMTGPLLILQTPGRVMLYREGVPVRRVAADILHVHLTYYDEDAFTEPVMMTTIWTRKTDRRWEVLDDASCFENHAEVGSSKAVDGFLKF